MTDPFQHDAVLYSGELDFLDRMTAFTRASLEADEPIFVMLRHDKLGSLRDELGADAGRVRFADMSDVGRNPARIIAAWEEFFLVEAAGRRARGIGEPIWAGRSPAEIVESQRHETLLNLAFRGVDGWLVCPYDVSELDPATIAEAYRSHPMVLEDGSRHASAGFRDAVEVIPAGFDAPLEKAPATREELEFRDHDLQDVRERIATFAERAGLPRHRVDDLVVAVSELAANSIRHGGGKGTLRVWRDPRSVVAEVGDRGRILEPLAGRRRPAVTAQGGFGLWLVNQLCDLVQVRTLESGSVVRVHVALPGS